MSNLWRPRSKGSQSESPLVILGLSRVEFN